MDAAFAAIAVVTVVIGAAFIAVTVLGVLLISRRSRRALGPVAGPAAPDSGALLRADEALRLASDELDFAVAQFGEEGTAAYREAIAASRTELRRAFEIQQRISDEPSADPRRRRDWARDVSAIARRVSARLDEEKARFTSRRDEEANAAQAIAALRAQASQLRAARPDAERLLDELRSEYAPALLETVAGSLSAADAQLTAADSALTAAETEVTERPVTAVGPQLDAARAALSRAAALTDAISRRRDELAAADSGLASLRGDAETDVAEATALRDDPPDADSADDLRVAIEAVETQLRAREATRRDPVAALDALVDVSDALDVAVSAARNQQRRLDGARGALGGALLSARTQIGSVQAFISGNGGRVGVDARTRLAEAERELRMAEHEADPVAALDGARRAATLARDADALARYRG